MWWNGVAWKAFKGWLLILLPSPSPLVPRPGKYSVILHKGCSTIPRVIIDHTNTVVFDGLAGLKPDSARLFAAVNERHGKIAINVKLFCTQCPNRIQEGDTWALTHYLPLCYVPRMCDLRKNSVFLFNVRIEWLAQGQTSVKTELSWSVVYD